MDERIQSLARGLREAPGDEELQGELRAALDRLPSEVAAGWRDDLIGAYYGCEAGFIHPPEKRPAPLWRRCGEGLLLPRAPRSLEVRWRCPGVLIALTHEVALIETPDGALEARRTEDGACCWRLPSAMPLDPRDLDPARAADLRIDRLPWAATPWGAAEALALHEAPLQYRRAGRWHPELGRVTEREAVDREADVVNLVLQVAVPAEGRWSATPPRVVRETAGHGEPLAGTDLGVETLEDQLSGLVLDPREPTLALFRWSEASDDGALYTCARDPVPAIAGLPYAADGAEPFLPAGLGLPGSGAARGRGQERYELSLAGVERAAGALRERFECDARGLVPWEGQLWITGPAGADLRVLPWGGALGPSLDLRELLDGYALRPWNAPGELGAAAALLPLDRLAVLVTGGESVLVLG
ncbi:MAG: hypothetical protein AB7N76_11610 [Planctomycetota bacterium]